MRCALVLHASAPTRACFLPLWQSCILAQRVGVGPGLVHYHFESLQVLLPDASLASMREALQDIDVIVEQAETLQAGSTCWLVRWRRIRAPIAHHSCSSRPVWRRFATRAWPRNSQRCWSTFASDSPNGSLLAVSRTRRRRPYSPPRWMVCCFTAR